MGFRARAPKQHASMWHEGFADCVAQHAPSCFETISEFLLSLRPRRADILLLRRKNHTGDDREGTILRSLWPRLAAITLVEFKSPTRGFRSSDLIRLASYGAQYHAQYKEQLGARENLTLVLVTPCPTDALDREIAHMGWRMRALGNGYAQIVDAWYTMYVAFTNQVAEAEHDDFLRIFSHLDVQSAEAINWLHEWFIMKDTSSDTKQRQDYKAMLDKLLRSLPPEQRLAGIPAEERLAGIPPEEWLAGMPLEERIRAMSDDMLRGLSDEYVRSLPKRVQRIIRKRLG